MNREGGKANTMMGYWVIYWYLTLLGLSEKLYGMCLRTVCPEDQGGKHLSIGSKSALIKKSPMRPCISRSLVLSVACVWVGGAPGRSWDLPSAGPGGSDRLITAAQRWPYPSWNQSLQQWLEEDVGLRGFSRGQKRYPKHIPNNEQVLTISDVGCRGGLGRIGRRVTW